MWSYLLPRRYRRSIASAFFGGLLVLGLALVRDYGISFDEGTQRLTGRVSLLYLFELLPARWQQLSPGTVVWAATHGRHWQLRHYRDRDYGVALELPLAAAEQVLPLRTERQVYLLRHGVTFLVCLAGLWAFYGVAARRFGSWRVGLLGTLLLVLSPRLFADYFYNDKDAVFMALFIVGVATATAFIRRPGWRTAGWHALAIDVRIMGILLPAATLVFVGIKVVQRHYPWRRTLAAAAGFGGLLAWLVVAMWPFLWEAPLANLALALRNMSHFRLLVPILYQGRQVPTNGLPWHYVPVWVGLTTPLPYLAFAAVGTVAILVTLLRRRGQVFARSADWQDVLFLGLAAGPVVAVIGLRSVLYNGWRQLYFIYPLLLLLALRGLAVAWRWRPAWAPGRRYWQPVFSGLGLASLLAVAGQMVRLHPFEHVYFNALAPARVERCYETDYWGLSFHAGLAWLLRHDARPLVHVYSPAQQPLQLNALLLLPAERQRLRLVSDAAQADYALQWSAPLPAAPAPCYVVRAGGVPLLSICCLK